MSDQASEQSLVDRMADQFLGPEQAQPEEEPQQPEEVLEASEDGQAEEQPPEEQFEEIEIDGTVYEVPAELKDKFMLQADYTRKTQELAEQRKAVDAHLQSFQVAQQQQAFEQSLGELKSQVAQLDQYLSAPVDWASLSTDQKLERLANQKQAESLKSAITTEIEGKRKEFNTAMQAEVEKLKREGQDILKRAIPNWGEATEKELTNYALSEGYTEAEVKSVLDARVLKTLWKAAQYDALKQKAGTAGAAAQSAPPLKKPASGRPMPDATRAKLDYRKLMNNPKASAQQKNAAMQKRVEQMFD